MSVGIIRVAGVGIAAVVLTLAAGSAPAGAVGVGDEGCTPGYWKNHPAAWEEFVFGASKLSQVVGDGVLDAQFVFPASLAGFADDTLSSALQGGGGPGLTGATTILVRAASAAVLNAAHDGLGYPLQRPEIYDLVNAALASEDRATILDVASQLDALNNLGCPL
ncbi:MAG: hypothetical protein ACRD0U_11905 [Acidimicrobiales bacterium]